MLWVTLAFVIVVVLGLNEVVPVYPSSQHTDTRGTVTGSSLVPIIDIRSLLNHHVQADTACLGESQSGTGTTACNTLTCTTSCTSTSRNDVARDIDEALRTVGVFILVGHPLSAQTLADSDRIGRELFDLPVSDKASVSMRNRNVTGRGYIQFGSESGLPNSVFEPKEGYSYGYNWRVDVDGQSTNDLQQPNIWPESFPNISAAFLERFYAAQINLAEIISEVLLPQYSAHDTTVISPGGDTISLMRMFHYQRVSEESVSKSGENICLGSSPHTDWGYLTLIAQDNVGGLEFFHDGQWMGVPYVEGGIVVNAGDFLRMVSNNRYVSPIHRVVCPTTRNRLSYVLFYYPGYDTQIAVGNPAGDSQSFDYNTMALDGTSFGTGRFGDEIIKKWDGVFRLS